LDGEEALASRDGDELQMAFPGQLADAIGDHAKDSRRFRGAYEIGFNNWFHWIPLYYAMPQCEINLILGIPYLFQRVDINRIVEPHPVPQLLADQRAGVGKLDDSLGRDAQDASD
jgi:hypothetical protein